MSFSDQINQTQALEKLLQSVSLTGTVRTRHKIIVGIDYGTTFSGISYVTTDKSCIEDINIISTWPGGAHSAWKTPTRIAYASENPQMKNNKWGFEVHPKFRSYSWTKLLLDQNATLGEHDDPALATMSGSGLMKVPRHRNAQGVCEDFLRELYKYMSLKLRQQMSEATFENTPMECWITLPAIWSDEAKDATLKAAKKAGFGSRQDDEVFTIAEPEAAAIATLKKYSETHALNAIKSNDHILICDCGGGTVDITTYTITHTQPHLEFDELCVGVGGKCGSTYIDRNLHTLLSNRFGADFDDVPFSRKGPGSEFMRNFERVKRDFGLKEDDDVQELGPIRLNFTPDSEYYDEDEHVIKLSYTDLQKVFDPVIEEITKLVRQQIREAKDKKGAVIDRVILVGGFAESPYLHKTLTEWCRDNGGISLMCPEHPQAAVVLGAALRGLEGIAPRMKQARRHYGISLNKSFREGIDPPDLARYDDWDNSKRCSGRMVWLINKGEAIFEDSFRTAYCVSTYNPGLSRYKRLKLFSSSLNDAPEYMTDSSVEEIGSIVSRFAADFDLGPSASSRYNEVLEKTIHRFEHQVQIKFGNKGENLTCQDVINGEVVSTAKIEFNRRR
ncbi:Hsp70 family protein-like protein [Cadophora sp. MPI-SDFR-AT-0126]|nr:Hsp70 family protein-like protein [Leotiomycetes sp. MPI-SDFR-AT-0126]